MIFWNIGYDQQCISILLNFIAYKFNLFNNQLLILPFTFITYSTKIQLTVSLINGTFHHQIFNFDFNDIFSLSRFIWHFLSLSLDMYQIFQITNWLIYLCSLYQFKQLKNFFIKFLCMENVPKSELRYLFQIFCTIVLEFIYEGNYGNKSTLCCNLISKFRTRRKAFSTNIVLLTP